MILLRVLAAAARPVMVAGAVATSATAGWYVYSNYPGDNPTAFERLQGQGERLLVNEFGADADTIVAIDPSDPGGSREVVATIEHARDYGAFAGLSPDGQAIAYTALPPDAPRPAPDAPATAGIIDADGTSTVLADDVDLLVTPIWAPDGSAIVVRKNTSCDAAGLSCDEFPAGSFELLLLGRDGSRSLITSWRSASAFPVGFSPDGGVFFFATLSTAGTDLYRVAPDGSGETFVAHLSDQVARDWRLSPTGTEIAFSAAESGRSPTVVARIVEVATGAVTDALPSSALEAGPSATGIARGEFNPEWSPDGGITVAATNLDGGSSTVSVQGGGIADVVAHTDHLELPAGWSPSGDALAVRVVEGKTPYEAGTSRVELVTDEGRVTISENADAAVVGWTE